MTITKKDLDAMAALRAKRAAPNAAPTPALGEERGTSGRRYLPAGTSIRAFAAHVGLSVAQLEKLNGRPLANATGPAWIRTRR